MKNYLVVLMIAVGAIALVATDADARRLGGGGSFGKQSQSFGRQAPAQQSVPNQSQARSNTQQQGQQAAPASPWRNILGGALLGLGLGALLAQFGIGGALANIIAAVLMIALLALAARFLYRMLRGKERQPAYAGAHGHHHHYESAHLRTPEIGSRLEPSLPPRQFQPDAAPVNTGAQDAPGTIPADFDVPAFVRNAKTYFIRLQAAWDRADINDIREFTSPEMFAELRMQLQERGASANHTDVVSLDADVLGVETVGPDYLVSVRFSGLIREEEGVQPEPFTEIWNLTKPVAGGGWVLAGIQQVS